MTKTEARKKGETAAIARAELIYTDTPYERLAKVLDEYRKSKAWQPAAERERARLGIPNNLHFDFAIAYVRKGPKEIERYISEAKSQGILKEL